jgi:dienelactone hydrolase
VLVLHAWWGLNDTIRAFCTRLVESGFVPFALDRYRGKVADTIADAETLSNALDPTNVRVQPLVSVQGCDPSRMLVSRRQCENRGATSEDVPAFDKHFRYLSM